jgi:hypothetical protein
LNLQGRNESPDRSLPFTEANESILEANSKFLDKISKFRQKVASNRKFLNKSHDDFLNLKIQCLADGTDADLVLGGETTYQIKQRILDALTVKSPKFYGDKPVGGDDFLATDSKSNIFIQQFGGDKSTRNYLDIDSKDFSAMIGNLNHFATPEKRSTYQSPARPSRHKLSPISDAHNNTHTQSKLEWDHIGTVKKFGSKRSISQKSKQDSQGSQERPQNSMGHFDQNLQTFEGSPGNQMDLYYQISDMIESLDKKTESEKNYEIMILVNTIDT